MFIQSFLQSNQSIQLQETEVNYLGRVYLGRIYRWLANSQIARQSEHIFYAFMIGSTAFLVLKEIARNFPNQDDGRLLSDMRVAIRHSYDNFMIAHPRLEFSWREMIISNLPTTLFSVTLTRLTEQNPAQLAHLLRIETISREILIYSTAVFLLRLPAGLFWKTVRDRIPGPVGPFLAYWLWLIAPRGFE